MSQDFWRLPKGVDEVLPPRARHLELLRRGVLDLFDVWGYDYIEPPIIEYLDALLVGNDLKLQTLQAADQVSGRALGVRADITAQAARIDANSLSNALNTSTKTPQEPVKDDTVRRLCYAGPVVRANPTGVLESRVPLKAGAEIYGCADVGADLEVMCLAIDALHAASVRGVVIELGHVGFVRYLADAVALTDSARARLFEAVRIKSEADIKAIFDKAGSQELNSQKSADFAVAAERLCQLVRLMGDHDALASARELFVTGADAEPLTALDQKLLELVEQLDYCAARLNELRPDVLVRFDLSAPVGLGYHQALVFALYDPEYGRAVARGGRYDGIGEQFGNARPATGFDLNLKTLASLPSVVEHVLALPVEEAVWVPFKSDAEDREARIQAVATLRAGSVRVVQALSAGDQRPKDCTRELKLTPNGWQAV